MPKDAVETIERLQQLLGQREQEHLNYVEGLNREHYEEL